MVRKMFKGAPLLRNARPLIPVLLFTSATAMVAQTNTTGLSGTIFDPSGALVPGATVTLSNSATGLIKMDTTKTRGEFSFDQLPPGTYLVNISSSGFAEQVQKVQLLVATPLRLNFHLTVGSVEVVNVEATSATVNATDATLGKPFDSTQVRDLPYLANNTLSLLALQPGVVSFGATNSTGATDIRSGVIDGARQDQTNLTLDGVDNNEANTGFGFGAVLRTTRDSVQEFRVVTSNANADSGRSSGAQVSLVTKSGTNTFHGSAYEYYRDPALAGNDWFNKQSQLNSGKPNIAAKILQHTYGASLGMPIIKDKLFFFGAYEGYKQATNSIVSETVPLASYKAGNIVYVNPAGSAATTTTLTPAQIAAIDPACFAASKISTIGGGCPAGPGVNKNILSYIANYPTSNASGGDGGYNTGAFTFTSPAPISQITNIARFDYNITPKQIVFVRGNLQGDNSLAAVTVQGGVPNSKTYDNTRGLAAGHIWTLNDHMTNNFRYGWVRYGDHVQGAVTGPYITFAEFTIQTPTSTSTTVVEDTNNFADDFTINKGRHTITLGVNDRLLYNIRSNTANIYNHAQINKTHLLVGSVAGTGQSLDPTALYGPVNSSFKTSYDNAVINLAGVITWGYGVYNFKIANGQLVPIGTGIAPQRDYHSLEQEYYVQDQWRVTPRLTLTGGLRWSYLGVPYEIYGQEVAPTSPVLTFFANRVAGMNSGTPYNVRTQTTTAGSANGKPNFWSAQKSNFAPTLSFAYAPDNKMSVRGGFRLAFDHFGEGVVNQFDAGGAFGLAGTVANGPNANIDTYPRYVNQTTQPTGIVPTLPTGGTFPTQYPDGFGSEYYSIDSTLKTPYAEVFNLTLQRELHRGLTVTAAYVGRLGRHLLENLDTAMPNNLYDPASGTNYFQATTVLDKLADQGTKPYTVAPIAYWEDEFANATATYTDPTTKVSYKLKGTQAIAAATIANRGNESATIATYDTNGQGVGGATYRYFHPQYATLFAQTSSGNSSYQGLQLSMRHTLARNFIYDFNYTYAKSMDMGSSPERSNANAIINSINPHAMYAVSDYDVRHTISADWVTSIPYGHGQRWGANSGRLMDELFGGWQVTGVAKYNSALPFTPVDSHGWPTTWESMSYMVKTGAPLDNPGHHRALAPVTATSPGYVENAFGSRSALPTCTSSCTAAAFREPYLGETGQRNSLRADGYFSVDPGVSKSFRTFENQSFRITLEAFNVFNSVRFNALTTGAFTSTFGQYSNRLVDPRQMQIAGRYTF
jgi:hypothetical protein